MCIIIDNTYLSHKVIALCFHGFTCPFYIEKPDKVRQHWSDVE